MDVAVVFLNAIFLSIQCEQYLFYVSNECRFFLMFGLIVSMSWLCRLISFNIEREVLDWQGLRIAGFADNTYIQLTVADWLALVAPWSGQSPHLNLTTSAWRRTLPSTPAVPTLQVEEEAAPSPLAARASQPRSRTEQIGFHRISRRGAEPISSTGC